MAKVLYGSAALRYRGRIRGDTFQKSLYGEQAETARWGTIRQTPGQSRIRAIFRYVVSMWRNLTPEERQSWEKTAKTAGGAFQAFVSFNIKEIRNGGTLVREDPTSLFNVKFTPTFHINDIKTDNTQLNLIVRWSANVNLESADFRYQTLLSFAQNIGLAPDRSNAFELEPELIGIQGQTLEMIWPTTPTPGASWNAPGLQMAVYLTPFDKSTNQPAGEETPYIFPENGNFEIKSGTSGVTVPAPGGQPSFSFMLNAPARVEPVPFMVIVQGYKMTDPAEVYDPSKNSILGAYVPVADPPFYSYEGILDPSGPQRTANPGDRFALSYIFQRSNPAALISNIYLTIPTVTQA